MGEIGIPELLIILVIVIVIFGPGKIAGLGAALGSTIKELRHSVRDDLPAEQSTSSTTSTPSHR